MIFVGVSLVLCAGALAFFLLVYFVAYITHKEMNVSFLDSRYGKKKLVKGKTFFEVWAVLFSNRNSLEWNGEWPRSIFKYEGEPFIYIHAGIVAIGDEVWNLKFFDYLRLEWFLKRLGEEKGVISAVR